MSVSSTISLRGLIDSLASGSININPVDKTSTTAPENISYVSLANGDNSITIPALASGVIIIFDSTSTTTKKIKGAGGDTGITVAKTGWLVLSFVPAAIASFIINSSAADTGLYTEIIFF